MPLVCSLGCSLISSNSYKGKIVIFCTALNELKHKSSNSYKGKIVMRRKRLTKKSNIVAIPIKVRLLSNQNYKIDL